MVITICTFLTAFVVTFFAIPSIIRIAEIKHLFDEPGDRKSHKTKVPTLGGLAIFAGLIFSLTFWATQKEIVELQYIICATLVLFFVGMKDDLFNLVAFKKLSGQLLASAILVHFGAIHITSFFGLFGVWDLPPVMSYTFSIFTIVVITNAMNLIDGIDGLAGSVGILAAGVFGFWFYRAEYFQYVVLSAALCGALLAFLYYNKTPAKIFMGDTGSLIVGIVLSILAIKFIELNRVLPREDVNKIRGVPVLTIGILIIPLFDTLRVFSLRILQGRSPFTSDRNHLHHLLLALDLTHLQATAALVTFNIVTIVSIYYLQPIRSEITLTGVLLVCLVVSSYLAMLRRRKILRQMEPLPENYQPEQRIH